MVPKIVTEVVVKIMLYESNSMVILRLIITVILKCITNLPNWLALFITSFTVLNPQRPIRIPNQ